MASVHNDPIIVGTAYFRSWAPIALTPTAGAGPPRRRTLARASGSFRPEPAIQWVRGECLAAPRLYPDCSSRRLGSPFRLLVVVGELDIVCVAVARAKVLSGPFAFYSSSPAGGRWLRSSIASSRIRWNLDFKIGGGTIEKKCAPDVCFARHARCEALARCHLGALDPGTSEAAARLIRHACSAQGDTSGYVPIGIVTAPPRSGEDPCADPDADLWISAH